MGISGNMCVKFWAVSGKLLKRKNVQQTYGQTDRLGLFINSSLHLCNPVKNNMYLTATNHTFIDVQMHIHVFGDIQVEHLYQQSVYYIIILYTQVAKYPKDFHLYFKQNNTIYVFVLSVQ
jgi:hypothetical protein